MVEFAIFLVVCGVIYVEIKYSPRIRLTNTRKVLLFYNSSEFTREYKILFKL